VPGQDGAVADECDQPKARQRVAQGLRVLSAQRPLLAVPHSCGARCALPRLPARLCCGLVWSAFAACAYGGACRTTNIDDATSAFLFSARNMPESDCHDQQLPMQACVGRCLLANVPHRPSGPSWLFM